MYTNGLTEADMDQIYMDRFTFNLIYATIIGTIIGELTASLMIDGYASLKVEDGIRDYDKTTLCYICAMSKPNVLYCLFRWKKMDKPSRSILSNISYGIISSIVMLLS